MSRPMTPIHTPNICREGYGGGTGPNLNERSTSAHIAEYYRHEGDYDEGIITQKDMPPQERRRFSWLEIACILGITLPVIVMLASLAAPIIGGLFE